MSNPYINRNVPKENIKIDATLIGMLTPSCALYVNPLMIQLPFLNAEIVTIMKKPITTKWIPIKSNSMMLSFMLWACQISMIDKMMLTSANIPKAIQAANKPCKK